jgi:hypothetical protein
MLLQKTGDGCARSATRTSNEDFHTRKGMSRCDIDAKLCNSHTGCPAFHIWTTIGAFSIGHPFFLLALAGLGARLVMGI